MSCFFHGEMPGVDTLGEDSGTAGDGIPLPCRLCGDGLDGVGCTVAGTFALTSRLLNLAFILIGRYPLLGVFTSAQASSPLTSAAILSGTMRNRWFAENMGGCSFNGFPFTSRHGFALVGGCGRPGFTDGVPMSKSSSISKIKSDVGRKTGLLAMGVTLFRVLLPRDPFPV